MLLPLTEVSNSVDFPGGLVVKTASPAGDMSSVPGQGSSACCAMQTEEEVIPEEDKI